VTGDQVDIPYRQARQQMQSIRATCWAIRDTEGSTHEARGCARNLRAYMKTRTHSPFSVFVGLVAVSSDFCAGRRVACLRALAFRRDTTNGALLVRTAEQHVVIELVRVHLSARVACFIEQSRVHRTSSTLACDSVNVHKSHTGACCVACVLVLLSAWSSDVQIPAGDDATVTGYGFMKCHLTLFCQKPILRCALPVACGSRIDVWSAFPSYYRAGCQCTPMY
jgi:hypothetical protein